MLRHMMQLTRAFDLIKPFLMQEFLPAYEKPNKKKNSGNNSILLTMKNIQSVYSKLSGHILPSYLLFQGSFEKLTSTIHNNHYISSIFHE